MHPSSLALVAAMPVGLSSLAAVASAALARSDRRWEVVLARTHARGAAGVVLKLVRKQSQAQGLGAVIERDARGDYEVAITGFTTQRAAAAARANARAGFPRASIVRR